MAKIKYIFRDFRWTVTKLNIKKYGFIHHLSKIYKLPEEEIKVAFKDPMARFRRWDISEDIFWKEFSNNLNKPIDKDCAKVFHTPVEIYAKQYKSVFKFVDQIKKLWYKNIILSDDNHPQIIKIKKLWRYKPFDSTIISCDVWLSKRDDCTNWTTKIFDYALKNHNLKSDEVIFVDDLEANCIAAEKAWIKSIVFLSPRQAIKDVKNILKIK